MSGGPLVSILIPTYRRPTELRKTLQNVIAQTYTNLEIIVSNNDCENAETNALCQEFVAKDKRISYHPQSTNIGGWANQTFLIRSATGEFALLMHDDDWISDNFIELTLRVLQSDPKCGVVQGRCLQHTAGKKPSPTYIMDDIVNDDCSKRILEAICGVAKGDIGLYHGLYRTSNLKSIVSDKKPRYGEDWTLVSKIASLGNMRSAPEAIYNKSIPENRDIDYYADFFGTPDIRKDNPLYLVLLSLLDSIAYDPFYDDKLDRPERMRLIAQLIPAFHLIVTGIPPPPQLPACHLVVTEIPPPPQKELIRGIIRFLRLFWRHPLILFKKKVTFMFEVEGTRRQEK